MSQLRSNLVEEVPKSQSKGFGNWQGESFTKDDMTKQLPINHQVIGKWLSHKSDNLDVRQDNDPMSLKIYK